MFEAKFPIRINEGFFGISDISVITDNNFSAEGGTAIAPYQGLEFGQEFYVPRDIYGIKLFALSNVQTQSLDLGAYDLYVKESDGNWYLRYDLLNITPIFVGTDLTSPLASRTYYEYTFLPIFGTNILGWKLRKKDTSGPNLSVSEIVTLASGTDNVFIPLRPSIGDLQFRIIKPDNVTSTTLNEENMVDGDILTYTTVSLSNTPTNLPSGAALLFRLPNNNSSFALPIISPFIRLYIPEITGGSPYIRWDMYILDNTVTSDNILALNNSTNKGIYWLFQNADNLFKDVIWRTDPYTAKAFFRVYSGWEPLNNFNLYWGTNVHIEPGDIVTRTSVGFPFPWANNSFGSIQQEVAYGNTKLVVNVPPLLYTPTQFAPFVGSWDAIPLVGVALPQFNFFNEFTCFFGKAGGFLYERTLAADGYTYSLTHPTASSMFFLLEPQKTIFFILKIYIPAGSSITLRIYDVGLLVPPTEGINLKCPTTFDTEAFLPQLANNTTRDYDDATFANKGELVIVTGQQGGTITGKIYTPRIRYKSDVTTQLHQIKRRWQPTTRKIKYIPTSDTFRWERGDGDAIVAYLR